MPALHAHAVRELVAEQISLIRCEALSICSNALSNVLPNAHVAAVLPWSLITTTILEGCKPQLPWLATSLRIGSFHDDKLSLASLEELAFPAFLPFSKRKGLFFQSLKRGGAKSEGLLQSVALRAICSLPIGGAQIYLIDLETKGRAFASLTGLDSRVAHPAPITPHDVTSLLCALEKRIADVTRRCLSRHEWLCEYNVTNPDEPEPYYFVCLSDFPKGLEKESIGAIDRLLAHECAARAGIYLLLSSEQAPPKGESFSGIPVVYTEYGITRVQDSALATSFGIEFSALTLVPDVLPTHVEDIIDMLNRSASAKPKSKKVVLDVSPSQFWSRSTANGLSVPIGKRGRQEVNFRFGNEGSVHHALIGGATGKGKTVLLHNLILHAAELYSPKDLQMILMDFKEGTEFACYEALPHMRILSIASELHFGHSVFEWLVEERIRRGRIFKQVGVTNLADYVAKTGQVLPRILVLMDEFQRLLSDQNIGHQVCFLLDDIVRLGRSFGINLVLSTQSLANVNVETSTLEQLGLRICLQLSEQEASRFLGYDNVVPAGFDRPGQALYNENQGRKEDNVEFQVAFVDAITIPERCAALREMEIQHFGRRIVENARVFYGEQPINPVDRIPPLKTDRLCASIGESLQINANPVEIILEQQDGANVICVGQAQEILNTISNNLVVQFSQSSLQPEIFVIDGLPLAKERWTNVGFSNIKFISNAELLIDVIDQLGIEIERRQGDEKAISYRSKLLILIEPQRIKAFPNSNGMDSSPIAVKFNTLLEQGARLGVHIVLITSRLAQTDKVLGLYGNPLNLQNFANKVVLRSDEAARIIGFDLAKKNIGQFCGVSINDATGETSFFQIYESINDEPQ